MEPSLELQRPYAQAEIMTLLVPRHLLAVCNKQGLSTVKHYIIRCSFLDPSP